jgi:hypothetical protein
LKRFALLPLLNQMDHPSSCPQFARTGLLARGMPLRGYSGCPALV